MVRLYLAGYKGYYVISRLPKEYLFYIDDVVIDTDSKVQKDYSKETENACKNYGLKFSLRKNLRSSTSKYGISIGWRFLIKDNSPVFVFHDSLLPRLRGFNPLVTALINGDKHLGVSCLLATENYDRGPLIGQKSIEVNYPLKIKEAIELIGKEYLFLFVEVIKKIIENNVSYSDQDESSASYSLWRDGEDYLIPWHWEAAKIKRFIDAVGFPYSGAKTYEKSNLLTVFDAQEVEDVKIENRVPGKVIFKNNDGYVIVCGKGLLQIKHFFDSNQNEIDLSKKFRIRFHS